MREKINHSLAGDEARRHLTDAYPYLADHFDMAGTVLLPTPSSLAIHHAVPKIVVGQMLSRMAAATIFERVTAAMKAGKHRYAWNIRDDELRNLGLSARKVRTLREFGSFYEAQNNGLQHWMELDYESLLAEVSSIWGMSDWSASMLAIFYFGLPDVFPLSDGTIKRAAIRLRENWPDEASSFDPARAAPFRTYLSLYLWRFIDMKLL